MAQATETERRILHIVEEAYEKLEMKPREVIVKCKEDEIEIRINTERPDLCWILGDKAYYFLYDVKNGVKNYLQEEGFNLMKETIDGDFYLLQFMK